MKPTTRQKMAKPIPTTKPTRKPKNNTKHQRGDKNGLKLTGPMIVYEGSGEAGEVGWVSG
jgi:hypothetical protein